MGKKFDLCENKNKHNYRNRQNQKEGDKIMITHKFYKRLPSKKQSFIRKKGIYKAVALFLQPNSH